PSSPWRPSTSTSRPRGRPSRTSRSSGTDGTRRRRRVAPRADASGRGRLAAERPQGLGDECVVVALREAGDGDDADDPDAVDPDGERAAVRGVLLQRELVLVVERRALRAGAQAHEVRRRPEALDDAHLALDPRVVVRRRALARGVEHLLRALAD